MLHRPLSPVPSIAACAVVLSLSSGIAGCAKTAADGPSWSLTSSRAGAPTAPPPLPPQPVYRGGRDPATGLAQPIDQYSMQRQTSVEMAPLPPVRTAPAQPDAAAKSGIAVAAPALVSKTADGRTIVDVRPGDTLTSIATTHRVSVAGLMFTNNLRSPVVAPGQRLVLPPR